VASKPGGELMQLPHMLPSEAKPHCGQLVFGCQGRSFRHALQSALILASGDAHKRQFCLKIIFIKLSKFDR
jgi:hypothetical protein